MKMTDLIVMNMHQPTPEIPSKHLPFQSQNTKTTEHRLPSGLLVVTAENAVRRPLFCFILTNGRKSPAVPFGVPFFV